jgi:hypothetical protein
MGLRVVRWARLGAVLAVGLVAACGSPAGSQPAARIVPELQNAATTATSVHIAGSLTKGNQSTTIDVSIDGDSVFGYLGAYDTRYYVLSLDGKSYAKLNAAFLNAERAPASLCATICGKYVALPSSAATQITSLLSMQLLVRDVFDTSDMNAVATSGCTFSPATRDGHAVLECRQGTNTLDVAAHGEPYLVYWSGPGAQHLTFSDWNSVVVPSAPPASQVVSYTDLG